MATGREHFALDWIKGELLETLNTARGSLEAFAEALESGAPTVDADGQSSLLRDCVNALHQIHGTLVMLELRGVTLLADHLERVSESLMEGGVADVVRGDDRDADCDDDEDVDDDFVVDEMERILGQEKMGFIGLIHQLLISEEFIFHHQ